MTIRIISATLLALVALPAMAQDTSTDPSLSLSVESSTSAAATAPLDAQITGDNSYAGLTAAINATAATDLSAVNDSAKVNIVKVSTLTGDPATEGAALDAAISAQSDALSALQSSVAANAAIIGKLMAEGYTMADVLAIRTDANGNALVYVDDR